ncbi:hypothetical protein [Streptomyces sp. NPDC051219]
MSRTVSGADDRETNNRARALRRLQENADDFLHFEVLAAREGVGL